MALREWCFARDHADLSCKNWYSISRTVLDNHAHHGTRMIARSAPSPSSPAPSARRYAALGLDRSARPSKGDTMPQMRARRCSPVLKIHARQTTSDRSSAGFLTSGHLVLWNKRLLMASQRRHNGGSREKAARRPGERPCRSDAWRSCAGSGELAPEVDHARVL